MRRRSLRLVHVLAVTLGAAACAEEVAPSGQASAPAPARAAALEPEPAADPSAPVARVNGVDVPRADFDRKYARMTRSYAARRQAVPPALARRYAQAILKELVDTELLRQKVARDGEPVDPQRLEAELTEYTQMFRREENLARYQKTANRTLGRIEGDIRFAIQLDALLERMADARVTEEEVRRYYEDNRRRYERPEQVRARHILVKAEVKPGRKPDPKVDAAARRRAVEIFQRATAPAADFAELARTLSEDPTASHGGDLGFFARGRMARPLEDAAFALKPGEVSEPVRTRHGWHVVQVVERREPREQMYEEVRDAIERQLRNRKLRLARQTLLEQLRAAAEIQILLPEGELTAAGEADSAVPSAP